MAADQTKLEGEINESPAGQERDVMALLAGMLRALIDEQRPMCDPGLKSAREPNEHSS